MRKNFASQKLCDGGQLLTGILFVEKNFAKFCLGWVEDPLSLWGGGREEMLGPDQKGTDNVLHSVLSPEPQTHQARVTGPEFLAPALRKVLMTKPGLRKPTVVP